MTSLYFLTIEEAAIRLKMTPQNVRALCRQRQIPGARKFGRQWRILEARLMNSPADSDIPTPQGREANRHFASTQIAQVNQ